MGSCQAKSGRRSVDRCFGDAQDAACVKPGEFGSDFDLRFQGRRVMALRSWMLKPLLGLGVFALAGAYLVVEAAPTEARTFVSLGIGVPVHAGPAYYSPPAPSHYPPPPPLSS